jgi:hypothetical protein
MSYPFHTPYYLAWHPVNQEGQVHVVLAEGGLKHALNAHRGKMMMLYTHLQRTAMSVYLPVINTM